MYPNTPYCIIYCPIPDNFACHVGGVLAVSGLKNNKYNVKMIDFQFKMWELILIFLQPIILLFIIQYKWPIIK